MKVLGGAAALALMFALICAVVCAVLVSDESADVDERTIRELLVELSVELPVQPRATDAPELVNELVRRARDSVSEVTRELKDMSLRNSAALVLGKLGGPEAARAMWDEFAPLLELARWSSIPRDEGSAENSDGADAANDFDPSYYFVLHAGLSQSGEPVVAEIVQLLDQSLREVDRLMALGEIQDLRLERLRDNEAIPLKYWPYEPCAIRACELLPILTRLRSDAAIDIVVAALRSRMETVRFTALNASRLWHDVRLAPGVASFLDDGGTWRVHRARGVRSRVRVQDHAVHRLARMSGKNIGRIERMPLARRNGLVDRYREEFAKANAGK